MKKQQVLALVLGPCLAVGLTQASTIIEWDRTLTVQEPPPDPTTVVLDDWTSILETGYVLYGVYKTHVYTDSTMAVENGAISWKERDTQGPGLSVVTGDVVTGENCIMSAGFHPDYPWGQVVKQCSDPFQSSKRFKAVHYALDAPLDLTFSVTDNGSTDVYRILQKYGNHTGSRVTGFTVGLGFMVNGVFIDALPGDGIAFCARNGDLYADATPTPSDIMNQGELDAIMAHGLFGAPDNHHPTPGYFNPYVRANFGLLAGETFLTTTGLAQVHRDLFGEWLPGDQMKGAFFFDDDGNPYTDNILMANCDGAFDEAAALAGAANAGCDGAWMTYRETYTVQDNGDGTYTIPAPVGTDIRAPIAVPADVVSAWMSDPLWIPGDIDDLANVNINTFLSISNANSWPTSDGNGNASFTLRVTPTFDATVAQAEPGTTVPDQFVVSIDAPTMVLP